MPGNSSAACRRWNGTNSLSSVGRVEAHAVVAHEERPARRRDRRRPTSMCATGRSAVNFQALPSRFCRTTSTSGSSVSASRPSAMATSTARPPSALRSSSTTRPATAERSTTLDPELSARDVREREQRVDELAHGLRRRAHALEVAAAVGADRVPVRSSTVRLNPSTARSGVLRSCATEYTNSCNSPVGRVQLARALGDAALELGVQSADLLLGALELGDVARRREHAGDVAVGVLVGGCVVQDGA